MEGKNLREIAGRLRTRAEATECTAREIDNEAAMLSEGQGKVALGHAGAKLSLAAALTREAAQIVQSVAAIGAAAPASVAEAIAHDA